MWYNSIHAFFTVLFQQSTSLLITVLEFVVKCINYQFTHIFPSMCCLVNIHECSRYTRKDDDDWVKKCMEYEVEGSRPRGRPKRTWKEVVREDCQARKLNKEDALDRCRWRKVIKEVR